MRAFTLLLGIFLTICVTEPAAATDLKLLGGPGGRLQRAECVAGSYMVGLSVMTGAWNDRVAPLCMFWDPQLQRPRGGTGNPQWLGTSNGGQFESQACPNHELVKRLVTGATVNEDNQAAFTQDTGVGCVSYLSPDTLHGSVRYNGGASTTSAYQENCPSGEVAMGIIARAGDFVDAIGLICGPPPSGRLFGSGPDPSKVTRVLPNVEGKPIPGNTQRAGTADDTTHRWPKHVLHPH